jgi:hypothetical protein
LFYFRNAPLGVVSDYVIYGGQSLIGENTIQHLKSSVWRLTAVNDVDRVYAKRGMFFHLVQNTLIIYAGSNWFAPLGVVSDYVIYGLLRLA